MFLPDNQHNESFQVLVFGDATHDVVPDLTTLFFEQDPVVKNFFDQAYLTIRSELAQLSPAHRAQYAPSANLRELVALHRVGKCSADLQQALIVICHLGLFIRYHTRWSPGNVAVLGLCAGSLSAAVVSSSNSLNSLCENAVQAVAVATRLGFLTSRASGAVEITAEQPKPWAFLLPGESAEKVTESINEFVRAKAVPPLNRPYISANAPNGVTVSGPPSVLAGLRSSSPLFQSKARDIGLLAAFHAPHLYCEEDIEWVLATISHKNRSYNSVAVPVLSSVTGKLVWTGSFRSLLDKALKACLIQPLRLDLVNQEIATTMRAQGATEIEVIAFATTAALTLLQPLKSIDQNIKLTDWTPPREKSHETSDECHDDMKIAVVGMSGRFPEAENIDEFWDLLSKGLDVCQEAPPTRWDVKTHVDLTGKEKNTSAVPWGCWLQNAGLYDPRFFGISPKEAAQCDPQQRLASMAAYEAMEDAGMVVGRTPSTHKERIGVFLGSTGCDWFETNTPQDISTFFISGGNRAFTPGRVNYVFNLCGPSYSIDTACSSSLAAIHLACNAIWRGDCDTALTGGTNMCTNPDAHAGLDRGFFLSRTGNCKTFDDGADGYCRGEAAGVVILKRLNDAIADKDPIRGVIMGINTNHSAESEAIVRPHAGAQSFLMQKVLNNAGVHPYDVTYVEMHGTGTQAGDAIEMQSVLETFASGRRDEKHGLHLGSVKANIGHGEGASGVSSLIKVLLMMEHDTIPPHCGIKTKINHNFPPDMEDRQVKIASKLTPWQRSAGAKRRVLINNFSAAGGNTALLLEDGPPESFSNPADMRTSHVVTISAKCAATLTINLRELIKFTEASDMGDKHLLPRLSYTTTARRAHYPFRVAVRGSTLAEIIQGMQEAIESSRGKTRALKPPTILMAFTGQGSQYTGMGRQLYRSFGSLRATLREFDQLARCHGYPRFLHIFSEDMMDIDSQEPIIVQLATVSLEVALARLLRAFGIVPTAVIGHSLGHYAALNVTQALSDSDMIYLVGKRAQLLQDCCSQGTHSMLAVRASKDTVIDILKSETINVACINGPEAVVLAGSKNEVKKWHHALSERGISGKILNTAYAFHSSQADPILEKLDLATGGINLRTPAVPVLCALQSKISTDADDFSSGYFSRHCRQPVNMQDTLRAAYDAGLVTDQTAVIEVGPQPVVTGMVKSTLCNTMTCHHILARDADSWPLLTSLLSWMYSAGVDLQWSELHADEPSAQKVLKLPNYGWDLKDYWMQYTGDWSLRKGMSVADTIAAFATINEDAKDVTEKPRPRLDSTTVHRIITESSDSQSASIVVEADITREDLHPITQGHKVNGIPLCTPSVYAEIAQNVGTYLIEVFRPSQLERLVDVAKLVVEKPLIPVNRSKGPQLIRCSTKVDWSTKEGRCLFYGIDTDGQTHTEYAWCSLLYTTKVRQAKLQSKVASIKERMQSLVDGVAVGTSARFSSAAAYKMVGILASFHPDFRGVEENILDSTSLEIVATLKFDKVKKGGKFITHPAAIDALTQPGGFAMNAKDSTDLELEVFVNHGWDSFQIYEPISLEKTYKVYTKMEPRPSNMWAGDNYVFERGRLVAFFEGVTLRKMPRKAFNMILNWTTTQDPVKPSPAGPSNAHGGRNANRDDGKSSLPTENQSRQSQSTTTTKVTEVTTIEESPEVASKNSTIQRAMNMIADESGIDANALTEDAAFTDLGIDSLLSMVIASRFREELGLEFSEEMTIFIDFPTVGSLSKYLTSIIKSSTHQGDDDPAPKQPLPSARDAEVSVLAPMTESTLQRPAAQERLDSDADFQRAMNMIAEESGVSRDDFAPQTIFADVGIDSLLSMVLASRFKEELGINLDDEMTIFVDFPTVEDLRNFFMKKGNGSMKSSAEVEEVLSAPTSQSRSSSSDSPQDSDSSSERTSDEEDINSIATSIEEKPDMSVLDSCRPTTSFILQGRPAIAKRTLFLFPDGGGSASSYIALPRLGQNIAVIGLNCPYARDPENMRCNLNALIECFINEVQRRQPHGPYSFGGWSSGGVFAFVAAQLLSLRGETIDSLVIIDAPTPNTMDALPTDFFDWAEQLRNENKSAAPAYLVPHFKATTDVMVGYRATPMARTMDVLIIWASKGLMAGKDIARYRSPNGTSEAGLSFLLDDKTDFGARGWDTLLPDSRINIVAVEGANHFTLMVSFVGSNSALTRIDIVVVKQIREQAVCYRSRESNFCTSIVALIGKSTLSTDVFHTRRITAVNYSRYAVWVHRREDTFAIAELVT
ncbi:polyketide synthase [Myriangium duriaei CBS 260.36]|uniref:Polyketide synthase n=1 Tax=Myriangium duriaei CBS 260.36 TaxID=1168546 RepID=A0A9P4MDZ7_9PEZI|nr:polyketide synthase [Myriangium duriaei CBS 260.36]